MYIYIYIYIHIHIYTCIHVCIQEYDNLVNIGTFELFEHPLCLSLNPHARIESPRQFILSLMVRFKETLRSVARCEWPGEHLGRMIMVSYQGI